MTDLLHRDLRALAVLGHAIPDNVISGINTAGFLQDLIGGDIVGKLGELAGDLGISLKDDAAKGLEGLVGGDKAGGFAFPILDDPIQQVMALLMGKEADLVTYDLAPLNFDFEFSVFFSRLGPLGVSLGLTAELMIDTAFIYDRHGIRRFVDTGFDNPLLILDGFAISDSPDLSGNDLPEVTFEAVLFATAELNLAIARAGVQASLGFEIMFDLFDNNKDGKIRFDEIITKIDNQLNAPNEAERLLAPLAIFDVSGQIFVELFAFLKIDFGLFTFEKEFPIVEKTTLVDFEVDFFRPPVLATEVDNGDLIINTGKFAAQRQLGIVEDVAERLEIISNGTEGDYVKVRVRAMDGALGDDADTFQDYKVKKGGRIIIDGGAANDEFKMSGFTVGAVLFEIDGGVGDDIVTLSDAATGVANAFSILKGGTGTDKITGTGGSDQIYGGGNDEIMAGNGDDLVFGDEGEVQSATARGLVRPTDGRDTIQGQGGQDILFGGGEADTIEGGALDDLILGDGGVVCFTSDFVFKSRPNVKSLVNGGMAETDKPTAVFNDTLKGDGGNDVIYAGAGNDIDDTIQGDGSIEFASGLVGASRDASNALVLTAALEALTDGDDYIEGNGGSDVVFGGRGQDDIVGGSSGLFTLTTDEQRPDGADLLFGGSGQRAGRNAEVALADPFFAERHARDADVMLGDNGDIFRLVGIDDNDTGSFLTFNYDVNGLAADGYAASRRIIPRAARQLDYTPGGPDFNAAGADSDIGVADELHGESGDDFIYGMKGNDVLFGDAQDDRLVGAWGDDWISGGTGDDGLLGDDGRIFVSRNSTVFGEPLYGIAPIAAADINKLISVANGNLIAIVNVSGQLKYTADLTPQNLDPSVASPNVLFQPLHVDDMLYGGLGDDSIHAGAGDDAISGAEAPVAAVTNNYDHDGVKLNGAPLVSDFAHPLNPGNVLGYSPATPADLDPETKFALYDADDVVRKILLTATGALSKTGSGNEWILNFDHFEGPVDTHWIAGQSTYVGVPTDGDDHLFADLGNDWIVGGTGRDTTYNGWGDDLVNVDDVLTTNGDLNDIPDTNPSYEDLAFGGAGRDVLIANTGGDRLTDWNGEFNTYRVPWSVYDEPQVIRRLLPALPEFLYALSQSQGADQTLAVQYGCDPIRNGEPFGELALVRHEDDAREPQALNTQRNGSVR